MGRHGSAALRERLADVDPREVATTIISYEERTRVWMKYISGAKSINQLVEAYRRLRRQFENYREIPILDFDEIAAAEYQRLRHARVRIGTMDLKIGAVVLSLGATLLSRNLGDFTKIPGLVVEDWTK